MKSSLKGLSKVLTWSARPGTKAPLRKKVPSSIPFPASGISSPTLTCNHLLVSWQLWGEAECLLFKRRG